MRTRVSACKHLRGGRNGLTFVNPDPESNRTGRPVSPHLQRVLPQLLLPLQKLQCAALSASCVVALQRLAPFGHLAWGPPSAACAPQLCETGAHFAVVRHQRVRQAQQLITN